MKRDLVALEPGILLGIIPRNLGVLVHSSTAPALSSRSGPLDLCQRRSYKEVWKLILPGGLEPETLERRAIWQIQRDARRHNEEAATEKIEKQ